ncbi:hypothetical protein [Lysobacter gummosus]|uniref:hypothetical protein n=1 Tax=Lysobacter gummosus TaxID=262324 RepID=UPI0036443FBF
MVSTRAAEPPIPTSAAISWSGKPLLTGPSCSPRDRRPKATLPPWIPSTPSKTSRSRRPTPGSTISTKTPRSARTRSSSRKTATRRQPIPRTITSSCSRPR